MISIFVWVGFASQTTRACGLAALEPRRPALADKIACDVVDNYL